MAPKIEPRKLLDHSIENIYVGKTKEALDLVGDHSLVVKEVTSMFGHFIKFRVRAEELEVQAQQVVRTNAFDVLMRTQRQLQLVCYPPDVPPRNKKDELYNDILKEFKAPFFLSVFSTIFVKKYLMNNGNEERALIKNLKFLDGKLNIKLEWPNAFANSNVIQLGEKIKEDG